jgi:1-acyl-sn-glycerol-3-phosphate acyltransferase
MSDWAYFGTRKVIRAVYALLKYSNNLDVKIEGTFPEEPTVLALNHQYKLRLWFFGWKEKWADHFLLGLFPTKRKIHFAVQNKQYMKPLTRFFLERIETFSTKDVRKGVRYAKNGGTVAIFPQGEAHRVHECKYYKGAAFIAKKGCVDITPVKLENQPGKKVSIKILPKIKTQGKTLEQITQDIKSIYSG